MPQQRTLIKTVGCEIEFAYSNRQTTLSRLQRSRHFHNWHMEHDGSCSETRTTYPNNDEIRLRFVRPLTESFGLRSTTLGGELVSPELNTSRPEWFNSVESVLAILEKEEKGKVSPLASTHVHVNIGSGYNFPIRYFHNLVKVIQYIEDGLYRLSCGHSKVHRGITNDFLYCRPNSSPPYVITYPNEEYVCPAFDMNLLLKTQEANDIKKALARLDHQTSKYVPARYVGVNFVSMFTLGSIEFRTFNSTFDAQHVKTWIELSRHLVELTLNDLTVDFDNLESHPIGEGKITLEEIIERLFIPPQLIDTLEDLWNMGTFSKKPKPILSHINTRNVVDWNGCLFQPQTTFIDNVERPTVQEEASPPFFPPLTPFGYDDDGPVDVAVGIHDVPQHYTTTFTPEVLLEQTS